MSERGTRLDQIQFRCSADPWPHHAVLTLRVPRGDFPAPGPCALCGAPMALVGRIPLQSAEEFAAHEVSG